MFVSFILLAVTTAMVAAEDATPKSACSALAACTRQWMELNDRCEKLRPPIMNRPPPPPPGPGGPPPPPPGGPPMPEALSREFSERSSRMAELLKKVRENEIQCWVSGQGSDSWCNKAQQARCEKAMSDFASGVGPTSPPPPSTHTPPPSTPTPPMTTPTPRPTTPLPAGVEEYMDCLRNASRQASRCSPLRGCCSEVMPCEIQVQTTDENIERLKLIAQDIRQSNSVCLFMPFSPPPSSPHPSSPHPSSPSHTSPHPGSTTPQTVTVQG